MLDCCNTLLMLITLYSHADQPPFTDTPYPRIAMLWSPVRGDNSIWSIAKHDLILLGAGGLGLKPVFNTCLNPIPS